MLGAYGDLRVLLVGLLGFSSGIPLLLTGSTLSLRLFREHGLTLTHIGLFGVATLPYAFKYLWAPLMDRLPIPYLSQRLGRRRSWILVTQLILMVALWGLAGINLAHNLFLSAGLVFFVALASASQDIVALAYQAEVLGRRTYGAGEAMSIFGYRMGMLLSSAGALYMTSFMSWGHVYFVVSLFVGVGMITTLIMKEPVFEVSPEMVLREQKAREYLYSHPWLKGWKASMLSWLYGAVVCPFKDFMRQPIWFYALLLMFFYKLGDNLIGTMSNIFYADLGFSDIEIANASKIFGMWTSILGGFIGGALIYRVGVVQSLFWFALLHALATLMYICMVYGGKSTHLLYVSIALEHITGGMRTTALFSYQLTLCNMSYAATQLAVMTSFVNLGRTIFSSLSGYFVDLLGWRDFFFLATFCTLPVLLIVWKLGRASGQSFFPRRRKKEKALARLSRLQMIKEGKKGEAIDDAA